MPSRFRKSFLTLLPDKIILSPHHENWSVDRHFKIDTSPTAVVPITAMDDEFKRFGGVEFFSTKERILHCYQVDDVVSDQLIIGNLGGEMTIQVGLCEIYHSLKSVSRDWHYLFYTHQLLVLWGVSVFWGLDGWDISAYRINPNSVWTDEPIVISEGLLSD